MAHLVRYRTPAGEVTTEEVADLDTAVSRVESLRNGGDADHVRVYAEVPLRVETVVRVSVAAADAPAEPGDDRAVEAGTGDTAPVPPPPQAPLDPPPGAMLAPVRVDAPSADAEDLVDADAVAARRGLFHRS